MAEGAPLLREYVGKTCIEGSNPSDSASEPAQPCVERDKQPRLLRYPGLCRFWAVQFLTMRPMLGCTAH